ncbi:MAG: phosphopantothenoylcysteine decarboxylase [Candidatus Omnitrophota bacterium]|nr:phosphopantothenoylcysteine decarboxylase [Candidatus Omnitrophota bacterium]
MTTRRHLAASKPLRVVITAGPTREPIDRVRFLSNYSTGYMGAVLAAEALKRGYRAVVVHGPIVEPLPRGVRAIPVEHAAQMERALRRSARDADVVVMAAAVSDFRAARPASGKWRRHGRQTLLLRATPDIIGRLPRRPRQLVVGFAVESAHVVQRARQKLQQKRLDLVLAQQANGTGAPFGRHPVQAWLLSRGGEVAPLGTITKPQVARTLLDKIEALWYGQPERARRT